MKKNVPFTKEISFRTMISKIISISLEHTLQKTKNNEITGDFIIDGKYKMTDASQIEEDFSYKIPVEIQIDDKYDISNINIDIKDFTYKIIKEDTIQVNINLCIDNIDDPDEIIDVEFDDDRKEPLLNDLFLEQENIQTLETIPLEYESENELLEVQENTEQEDNNQEEASAFMKFDNEKETYKSYTVYITKDEDNINSILAKYKIKKEKLEEYNDITNIYPGTKIIIPCDNNE